MATHVRGMSAPPAVRARGLLRAFESRVILDRIDLDIAEGEFVALLGRSGSGKSTLLRALAGLDHDVPGMGELVVSERQSVIFQDARLLPWKRVLDNVVFGLAGPDALEKARQALDEVELGGREAAWPNELSGGEQQRVALARCLVRDPQLLLADEPFGALDALTRIRMHDLLRRLCERHNPAVLLVTHDVDEAIELADRILVLEHGKIAADITVDLPSHAAHASHRFAELRTDLLQLLGVEAAGGQPERHARHRS